MHAFNTRYKQQHDDTPSPGLLFSENRKVEVYLLALFQALQHCDRPDLVFGLWDSMEILYDVSPNELLLSQLVRAAIVAINLDNSLEPVEQPSYIALEQNTLSREQARDGILRMMEESRPTKIRWKNSHPGLIARQIWRRAMIIHNPSLVNVQSPILTTAYDGAVSAATFERIATFRHQRLPEKITPTSMLTAFHCYIMLLESMSLWAEVPLIIAWMHAFKIEPPRKLREIIHGLWDEFSRGESRNPEEKRQHARFSKWLRGWTRKCRGHPPLTPTRVREILSGGKNQAGQITSEEQMLPQLLDTRKDARNIDGAEEQRKAEDELHAHGGRSTLIIT
ncbi:hypothetical protein PILCRDRAFT_810553 [Piloderma croceum F 1598]|uniref:Uncharacterized protein n=1 Tax=Piloderma croceum (strain F 1598) TaxID=765440 RepID=A0A0C3G4V8_PILCF|nr:hypothetical protein PILCRDRAFT_810553 [Piloderma croceum F 1598]